MKPTSVYDEVGEFTAKQWGRFEKRMSPKVHTDVRLENRFRGSYKGYEIEIERDNSSENWYIQVRAPTGPYVYDGSCPGSFRRSLDEAIQEALKGAKLI